MIGFSRLALLRSTKTLVKHALGFRPSEDIIKQQSLLEALCVHNEAMQLKDQRREARDDRRVFGVLGFT